MVEIILTNLITYYLSGLFSNLTLWTLFSHSLHFKSHFCTHATMMRYEDLNAMHKQLLKLVLRNFRVLGIYFFDVSHKSFFKRYFKLFLYCIVYLAVAACVVSLVVNNEDAEEPSFAYKISQFCGWAMSK